MDASLPSVPKRPRIVIVGPCGSGKTTLVDGLRRLGVRAMVCGQEHSDVATLWRHTEPDLVVALEIDLSTLRQRRGDEWPEWLFQLQRQRLRAAIAAADLRLDATGLDAEAVLRRVARWLALRPPDNGSTQDDRPAGPEVSDGSVG